MGEEGNQFVGFALAVARTDKENLEKKFLKIGKRKGVWRRRKTDGWKGPRAVDNVDSVFSVEREVAMVVVVGVLVREGELIRLCAGEG